MITLTGQNIFLMSVSTSRHSFTCHMMGKEHRTNTEGSWSQVRLVISVDYIQPVSCNSTMPDLSLDVHPYLTYRHTHCPSPLPAHHKKSLASHTNTVFRNQGLYKMQQLSNVLPHFSRQNSTSTGGTQRIGNGKQLRNTSTSVNRRICDTHAGMTSQNTLNTIPQKEWTTSVSSDNGTRQLGYADSSEDKSGHK